MIDPTLIRVTNHVSDQVLHSLYFLGFLYALNGTKPDGSSSLDFHLDEILSKLLVDVIYCLLLLLLLQGIDSFDLVSEVFVCFVFFFFLDKYYLLCDSIIFVAPSCPMTSMIWNLFVDLPIDESRCRLVIFDIWLLNSSLLHHHSFLSCARFNLYI